MKGFDSSSFQVHAKGDAHLSLGCSDSGPARVDLLIDGGEKVLRNTQSVLQEWEVWVVFRSVFQQVLCKQNKCVSVDTVELPILYISLELDYLFI